MLIQTLPLYLSFVLQATAAVCYRQSLLRTSEACPTGFHIVGVRGTLEAEDFGALQAIVDEVLKELPGSDAMAIDYPAGGITRDDDGKLHYDFFEYRKSEEEGRVKFNAEIESFAKACPHTGIIVMGYSQASTIIVTHLRSRRH
jgi:Cutinase